MFCQLNKCNSRNLPKSPPASSPVSMSGNILGSLSVRMLTLWGVTKAEKGGNKGYRDKRLGWDWSFQAQILQIHIYSWWAQSLQELSLYSHLFHCVTALTNGLQWSRMNIINNTAQAQPFATLEMQKFFPTICSGNTQENVWCINEYIRSDRCAKETLNSISVYAGANIFYYLTTDIFVCFTCPR